MPHPDVTLVEQQPQLLPKAERESADVLAVKVERGDRCIAEHDASSPKSTKTRGPIVKRRWATDFDPVHDAVDAQRQPAKRELPAHAVRMGAEECEICIRWRTCAHDVREGRQLLSGRLFVRMRNDRLGAPIGHLGRGKLLLRTASEEEQAQVCDKRLA